MDEGRGPRRWGRGSPRTARGAVGRAPGAAGRVRRAVGPSWPRSSTSSARERLVTLTRTGRLRQDPAARREAGWEARTGLRSAARGSSSSRARRGRRRAGARAPGHRRPRPSRRGRRRADRPDGSPATATSWCSTTASTSSTPPARRSTTFCGRALTWWSWPPAARRSSVPGEARAARCRRWRTPAPVGGRGAGSTSTRWPAADAVVLFVDRAPPAPPELRGRRVEPAGRSPRSCGGSTACRSPSSWRPAASRSSLPSRSPRAWVAASTC